MEKDSIFSKKKDQYEKLLNWKRTITGRIAYFYSSIFFRESRIKEDGKTGQQGWYVGVEGGMPEHLHKNNFVWESGVRLGINLPFTNHK